MPLLHQHLRTPPSCEAEGWSPLAASNLYCCRITCILTLQVKIMKDFDPTGKRGPRLPLPDVVKVRKLSAACRALN